MSALGERRLPRTGQGGGLPFEQHPFQNFISEGRTRQADFQGVGGGTQAADGGELRTALRCSGRRKSTSRY
jgi:hypothetical protein